MLASYSQRWSERGFHLIVSQKSHILRPLLDSTPAGSYPLAGQNFEKVSAKVLNHRPTKGHFAAGRKTSSKAVLGGGTCGLLYRLAKMYTAAAAAAAASVSLRNEEVS